MVRKTTIFIIIFANTFFFSTTKLLAQTTNITSGVWEVQNDLACSEKFTFLSDSRLLLESGTQMATKDYKLKRYRKSDFYSFSQRTLTHNGATNCVGKMGVPVDGRFKVFIKVDDTTGVMSFYRSPDDQDVINVTAKRLEVAPPADGEEEEIVADTPMEF